VKQKATNVEQWAANKPIHYNEWANFGEIDFEPAVSAFRELLDAAAANCGSDAQGIQNR
jgi:hypothetical protein